MEQPQIQEQNNANTMPTANVENLEMAPLQPAQPAQQAANMPLQQDNDPYESFKLFLSTAPVNWSPNESIRRFTLEDGQSISCVLWNELFHITGTDIVKAMAYRFECLGRTVTMQKKFEEGIFSDLRNLKPMSDSSLEESRSPFLKFLYENQCIRTQKKQKVFYWFSVKHDKLFLDALERDLKRESAGQTPCTMSRVPMSMVKSMELAKSLCMPQMQSTSNKAPQQQRSGSFALSTHSLNIDHPTPRMSSAGNSASSQHYMPMLNYSHPMDQHQRSYSPFQQQAHHLLHPGSPPQGIMTPPIMHQQYSHSYEHEGYRIMRNESPLSIHRTDSPLGIHRSDSPAHSIMSHNDAMSMGHGSNYEGAYVLSSMFNPHDYSASAPSAHQNYVGNSNVPYSPYQTALQNPVPIRRHSPSPQLQMQQQPEENKIYDCPYQGCTRQFKRQEHLKRHYRSHTGERPYTCIVPECRQSFARSDYLQLHMRRHNETGNFRLDDNLLQSFAAHTSDFQIPSQSPSFDQSHHHLDYQPMRSDSRLSMHSSFEPLMSIPAASTSSAPAQQAPADEIVAAAAAAAAAAVESSEDNQSKEIKEEYTQNMDSLMGNLIGLDHQQQDASSTY